MADSSLTRKATHRSSSQKKVEIRKLREGDASCLLLFVSTDKLSKAGWNLAGSQFWSARDGAIAGGCALEASKK